MSNPVKSIENAHLDLDLLITSIEFNSKEKANIHYDPIEVSEKGILILHAEVSPWEYGAKVSYTDSNGVEHVEHLSYPPPVGRFSINAYNQIVRFINSHDR